MTHYFDTSFVAPIFLTEPTSDAVQAVIRALPPEELAISHWTRVEFASLLGIRLRMKSVDLATARDARSRFERVVAAGFAIFLPDLSDFDLAREYLDDVALSLRGGDAFHLAIAANRRVTTIHTLDKTMLKAGATLGLPVSGELR